MGLKFILWPPQDRPKFSTIGRAGALAGHLNVPRTRIERIVKLDSPITSDTALRLSKFFGTTPEFWANMQSGYDLKVEAMAKEAEIATITAHA